MNKQQLASKIWASANKMRSKIEANEYKDYILGFIFYKFLSDTEVKFLKENDWTDEAIKEYLYEDKVPETVEQCKNNLGYFIAYPDLFSTWIAPDSDFGVADVRDALNRFARFISPAHQKVYKGIFDTLQNGLSKLGESTGAQTKAINNLLQLIKDIPTDGSEDYDVLGFIYEYLISNFAANAGKKAGEFYTPHEVALMMSEIVAHHLHHKEEITIYDPTSGSGSLLLNIGRSVGKYLAKNKITYYAQELKEATYNLTRMNLVMRGIHPDNILVRNGDTLEEDWPWFDDSDPFASYKPLYCDAVVSNPPYSQEWSPKEESSSDPRYSKYGVAPKGTADYAFLLHDLYHVKPDGIMTIVLPHGVLFRGGSEEEIRKNLIEKNNIDAIIGLPANIFFGTGIPTIVMVLRQKRENDDVLFVDASKGFAKVGKNNQLRARDIRKIVDAVTERREIPKFSRRVSRDTIRENDYNLNIPRYVNSAEADEQWDIYATMFGGIPNNELDSFAPMWSKFPSLRAELFRDLGNGYSELIPSHDDLRRVIADNAEVRKFNESYAEAVSNVGRSLDGHLIDRLREPQFVADLNPQSNLTALTSILFDQLKPFTLIDEYAAYQVLTKHWAQISGDLEIIHSEGLVAANAVDPNMVAKKKDGKDVEVQDGWAGRIIPIDLVERVMLSDELAAVENDRAALEATRTHIAEIIENLPEAEGETPWVKEDGSAFVPKELKAKVKKIKQEYGSKAPEGSVEAMLLDADKSLDLEKKQKAAYNAALVELISKAIETIENLTPDDIITLLKAKWSAPLNDALIDVDRQLINDFTSQLTSLSEKYSETLVDIDNNITSAEKSLASLIDNLTGSDNDMAGLREFQKLLRHE